MTNLKDLNSLKMDKNLGKVVDALVNDPFGLSAAQIANNSKMSLKTVKNCLSVLMQDEKIRLDDLGVYHTMQKANEVDAAPVTQKATQSVVSAQTGKVMEVVKASTKADAPTPPTQSISAEGFDAKITPTNLLGIIPVAQPQAEQQSVKATDDKSKPIKVRILDFINSHCLLSFNGVTSFEIAQELKITKRQADNACYALQNQGCLKSEGEADSKHYFYVQDIPRKRAEPCMKKTPKLAKAAASPFDGWIERQVIETKQ